MNNKILVTGATGFIGSQIIEYLISNKDCQIIASDIDECKASQMPWFNKVDFRIYNLKEQRNDLFEYFEKPDSLIHLSWSGLPNYNKLFHIEENLIENIYFLKALAESHLKRITIAGTCMEYGLRNGQMREDMPANPVTPYAAAKDMLRRYGEFLASTYNIEFRWARIFYLYSNASGGRGIISQLDQAIQNGDEVFNLSGGEQLRDFLPIENIVKSLCEIAFQNEQNGIFNCCSGKPISIKTIVQNRIKELDSNIKLNFGYYPYPDYEPMAYWGDASKLQRLLSGICDGN